MPVSDQLLKLERFEVKVETIAGEPPLARVVLTGRIDIPNPSAEIGVFLSNLHDMFSNDFKQIVVDAVNLAYINSSGIKMMADWMVRVNEGTGYVLNFKLNEKLAWHNELLSPLRHLAPEKIFVEYVSG